MADTNRDDDLHERLAEIERITEQQQQQIDRAEHMDKVQNSHLQLVTAHISKPKTFHSVLDKLIENVIFKIVIAVISLFVGLGVRIIADSFPGLDMPKLSTDELIGD